MVIDFFFSIFTISKQSCVFCLFVYIYQFIIGYAKEYRWADEKTHKEDLWEGSKGRNFSSLRVGSMVTSLVLSNYFLNLFDMIFTSEFSALFSHILLHQLSNVSRFNCLHSSCFFQAINFFCIRTVPFLYVVEYNSMKLAFSNM